MVCARPMTCPCVRPCHSVDDFSPIMTTGESFRFQRGDVIWQRGEPANHVVVVCTGTLKLSQPGEEGREVIVDLIHRGQMIGEEAALPATSYPTTLSALAPGKAMKLSREKLQNLLRQEPELGMTLLQSSYRQNKMISTRLEEMTTGSVRGRVARLLLRLSQEVGLEDARGRFVPVPLKRGDIADMVACRVETVIRVMTEWERENMLETQREGFVLRDIPHLKQMSSDSL